jgi:hypothetical protein
VNDAEIDYDDPRSNQGVQHVVYMLARLIGSEGWLASDGSEDYDSDLEQTLLNILAAKGLHDRDRGEFASIPADRRSPAEIEPEMLETVRKIAAARERRLAELVKENERLRAQLQFQPETVESVARELEKLLYECASQNMTQEAAESQANRTREAILSKFVVSRRP